MDLPPTQSLKALLEGWGLEDILDLSGMASEIEARVVPSFADGSHPDAMAQLIADGVPVLAPAACAQRVIDAVPSGDGLAYVCDPRWNHFPKPKVAMVSGWGRPGTKVDAVNDRDLALATSFEEVLQDPRTLNLQMFHRDDQEDASSDEPPLPVLPDCLDWPCPEFFAREDSARPGRDGGMARRAQRVNGDGLEASGRNEGVEIGGLPEPFLGVRVDRATRVSKRGALTWWHLDDSGEHTFQVALPLQPPKERAASPSPWGKGVGPTGRPIVKLFLFAELDDYDFVFQDEETNATGRVAAFDPFRTPSVALPSSSKKGSAGAASRPLPRFWVAPLEAGGAPLLSPPNMPHLVLSCQDCVMVEERRISVLFVDEVTYFVRRAAGWNTCPILYPFLREGLCDSALIEHRIVAPLLAILKQYEAQEAGSSSLAKPRVSAAVAGCARSSLLALQSFRWLSRCADMGLDEELLRPTEAVLDSLRSHGHLLDPASSDPLDSSSQGNSSAGGQAMSAEANLCTRLAPLPHRHKRQTRSWAAMLNGESGVLDLGLPNSTDGSMPQSNVLRFAACVHVDGGRAVWGPLRATTTEARADRLALQLALEQDAESTTSVAAAPTKCFDATLGKLKGVVDLSFTGDNGGSAPPKSDMMEDLFGGDSDSD